MNLYLQKSVALLLTLALLIPAFIYINEKVQIPFTSQVQAATLPVIDYSILPQAMITAIKTTITAIKAAYTAVKTAVLTAYTVMKYVWDQWVQNVWKVLLEYFKLKVLDMMTNQIISWITGGAAGQAQFVTNWGTFSANQSISAQDIIINEVDKASGGLLCSPFSSLLRQFIRPPAIPVGIGGFQYNLTCTLDKVVQNIQSFYNDFSQGNFYAYLNMYDFNNNFYGNFIQVIDRGQQLEYAKQQAALNEARAGQGYTGQKRCKTYGYDDDGQQTCEEWEITTPGTTLGSTVNRAIANRFDYVPNIQQIASIVAIVVDGAVNRLIGAGVNGLFGYGSGGGTPGVGYISPGTNFNDCSQLTGPAQDACIAQQQSQQPETHLACQENACIRVQGAGTDQCAPEGSTCNIDFSPKANLSVSATAITPGSSATISWSSSNATRCTASGGWSGDKTILGGSETITPSRTTNYTLTCSDGSISSTAQVAVAVTQNPTSTVSHLECLNFSCVSVPGGGANSCAVTADCSSNVISP